MSLFALQNLSTRLHHRTTTTVLGRVSSYYFLNIAQPHCVTIYRKQAGLWAAGDVERARNFPDSDKLSKMEKLDKLDKQDKLDKLEKLEKSEHAQMLSKLRDVMVLDGEYFMDNGDMVCRVLLR